MKQAISITLDDDCIRYLGTKMGKRSHYVNKLIVEDMQKHLETKKVVWISCKVCKETDERRSRMCLLPHRCNANALRRCLNARYTNDI